MIPRQLCQNAGLDALDVLNKLRHRHAQGEKWAGIDIHREAVGDNLVACVWEPSIVKRVSAISMKHCSNIYIFRMPSPLRPKLRVSSFLLIKPSKMHAHLPEDKCQDFQECKIHPRKFETRLLFVFIFKTFCNFLHNSLFLNPFVVPRPSPSNVLIASCKNFKLLFSISRFLFLFPLVLFTAPRFFLCVLFFFLFFSFWILSQKVHFSYSDFTRTV